MLLPKRALGVIFFFSCLLENPSPCEPHKPPGSERAPHISPPPKKTSQGRAIPAPTTPDWGKNIKKKKSCEIRFSPHNPALKADGGVGLKGDNSKPQNCPNPAEIIPPLSSPRGAGAGSPSCFLPPRAELVPGISTPAELEEYNKN